MADLHSITLDEIVDFLAALGDRSAARRNVHLQEAFALTVSASNLSEAVRATPSTTTSSRASSAPSVIRDGVVRRLGVEYLEGWVHERDADGRDLRVRAFGARTTHVVAGNSPGVSAQTIVRNAVTRSDAIIKTPTNDPVTAVAILRTMVDLDPDHPLTQARERRALARRRRSRGTRRVTRVPTSTRSLPGVASPASSTSRSSSARAWS